MNRRMRGSQTITGDQGQWNSSVWADDAEEIEGERVGTVTTFPMGSRTTVQGQTHMGLTSGFGMGPGRPHGYDRAPTLMESELVGGEIHPLDNEAVLKGIDCWSCLCIARLNTSANLRAYTRDLSPRLLRVDHGYLVFGWASSLDAFSSYPVERGYPAVPCRTTGRLVAPSPRSSRTKGPFPSGINASTTKQQTCLTTV